VNRGAALLLTVLVPLAPHIGAAATLQKITITVPSTDPDQGAFFIAAQKGYFAAEGLECEFVYAGGGVATPGLLSGSVDGSASSASALTAILRGAPLRVILVFEDSAPYEVWATGDVRTLGDLRGKSVGIATRGDTFEIAMRLALAGAGLSGDAVGYTPLGTGGTAPAALESGALPAVVIAPEEAITMQDRGLFKNARMIADFSGKVHMPFAGFAVAEKLLYGNPALARKIVRAIVKGVRYEKAFKNETVAIVGKYQKPVAHPHASEVEYEYFMHASTRDLTFSNDLIATDLAVRAELAGIPRDKIPPIDKVYDFSLVRSINAELDAARWKPSR
jgi:ABC-type nitrate/sulfonate/bicarbonate transport system substrate-binding protein